MLFPWNIDNLLSKGEGGAFLMRYDLFFLLDSLFVCIFCPKKCLTTLKVVMSMTYTCSSSERSSGCLFKDDNQPGKTISKRHMLYPVGDVCLDLTCK